MHKVLSRLLHDHGMLLGLGLSLSLAIIESFGGRLAGRNLPEGGAEFSVTLQAA